MNHKISSKRPAWSLLYYFSSFVQKSFSSITPEEEIKLRRDENARKEVEMKEAAELRKIPYLNSPGYF